MVELLTRLPEQQEQEAQQPVSVVRGLVYSLRTSEELMTDLQENGVDATDIWTWNLAVKSVNSRNVGKLELTGGRIHEGESPQKAISRHLDRELNLRQINGIKLIGEAEYTIPNMSNGERDAKYYEVGVFNLDKAYPLDSTEAKVGGVVSLTSSQLVELLSTGEVEYTDKEGKSVKLNSVDYLHMCDENSVYKYPEQQQTLYEDIIGHVMQKELDAKAMIADASSPEEATDRLFHEHANVYLKKFAKEPAYRFFPALMYAAFGSGVHQFSWEQVNDLIDTMQDVGERDKLRSFLATFHEAYTTFPADQYGKHEVNQLHNDFTTQLEQSLGYPDNTFNTFAGYAARYFKEIEETFVNNGIVKTDISRKNEIMNIRPYRIASILFDGKFYDKPVSPRVRYEAARQLETLFGMIDLKPEYDKKYKTGDGYIEEFMARNFLETENEESWVKGESHGVRAYTNRFGETLAVVIREGDAKTFESFYRKCQLGERPNTISDIYRQTAVLIGKYNENGTLAKFDIATEEGRREAENTANELFMELIQRFQEDGMHVGDSALNKNNIVNQLTLSHRQKIIEAKGKRPGSISDTFPWGKFNLFEDKVDGERSEFVLWADANSYQIKIADDLKYAWRRMKEIAAWYMPDPLYPVRATQHSFQAN